MNKGIIYLLVAVAFVALLIFLINPPKPGYFDDGADVMYFYYDDCSVCSYIKPALQQLGEQGYRVKPFDVHADQMPEGISIQGTPTFIGSDGEKLEGMIKGETVEQFKLRLQKFLDKY